MGGRGASIGISETGKRYGTEYKTVAQFGEVKYVRQTDENASVTAPMETVTRGRIYATLDKEGYVKHITFYDSYGERTKQIDVKGKKHNDLLPHTHLGYEHDELGTRDLSPKEKRRVESILSWWERKRKYLTL